MTQGRIGRTKHYLIDLSKGTKGESDTVFQVAEIDLDTARGKRECKSTLERHTTTAQVSGRRHKHAVANAAGVQ